MVFFNFFYSTVDLKKTVTEIVVSYNTNLNLQLIGEHLKNLNPHSTVS